MAVRKDLTSSDDGYYVCELCGQHCTIDEINFMDGHDYQYWAAGMVCDDCIRSEQSD